MSLVIEPEDFKPPNIRKDKFGSVIIRRSLVDPDWERIEEILNDELKGTTNPLKIEEINKRAVAQKQEIANNSLYYQKVLLDVNM